MITEVDYEKIHSLQTELIRKQDRTIDELRASNRILEAANKLLAEALSRALTREGRDRVFIPAREANSDAEFRTERTIDNDILIIRVRA